jgi:shikimate dehydrogenase
MPGSGYHIGAGGAARAIAFILADKGVQLTILNRDEARAERLAEAMVRLFRREVAVGGLTKKNVKKVIDSTEILVNTTSVGMLPDTESSPLPPGLLRPEQVVFDIVYNPPRTALLKEAEALGARAIGGLEMLVQQGAAGFELWTGRKAPLEVMRSVAASLI